jgi:hypothetical protein
MDEKISNFPIIIKDVLPIELLVELHLEFSESWGLTNSSYGDDLNSKTSKNLFWSTAEKNSLHLFDASTVVKLKILRYIKKDIRLIRIMINGQTRGQVSKFHPDYFLDCYYTFILFSSLEWNSNWGGEFVCLDPKTNEYKYVPYVPNTGCLIPSNWEHMGSSPNASTDKMRQSIAFSFCLSEKLSEELKNNPKFCSFL